MAGVDVVVEMPLAAGAPGDRQDLGHPEDVVDAGDAEGLGGGRREARGEDLAADVDPPQPDVARPQARAAGR